MSEQLIRKLIDAGVAAIVSHADELTTLDQAIGDGDHGINMKRGFDALAAEAGTLSAKPPAEASTGWLSSPSRIRRM